MLPNLPSINKLFLTILLTKILLTFSQFDLQDYGVIIDGQQKSKYHWGTYKPNLYFAMKNRRNTSQVFGLMWYGADSSNFQETPDMENRIRHDCKMEDNLKYFWERHNGLDFGSQIIQDEKLNLKLETKFLKETYNYTEQSWTAVIEGNFLDESSSEFKGAVGLLLYNALENNDLSDKAFFSFTPEGIIEAQEKGKTEFHMKYILDKGEILDSSLQKYRKIYNETWRVKKFVTEDLKNSEILINEIKPKIRNIEGEEVKTFERNPEWTFGKFVTKQIKQPNIVVQQYIFKKPFRIFVKYSLNPFDSKAKNLQVEEISEKILTKEQEFDKKFNEIFPIANNPEDEKADIQSNSSFNKEINKEKFKHLKNLEKMGKQALSNLLGGIGHFWGKIKIHFEEKLQPGQYHKGFRYAVEDKELLTGSPSRSFFPRGFLWDEGFHNILISKWDIDLSIDIINSWLSTMSATGWMAREQIRGAEAESKVPSKFLTQNKLIANPPTLIFPLNRIVNYYKNNFEVKNLKKMSAFLKKCQDKFSSWYEWFEIYQKSSDRKSYQWYGRTNSHNLASGLDDFPRGLSPNLYEKHLDLNIWVIELLKSLRNLSEIFDYELMQHFNKRIQKMESDLKANFFDAERNIYADYLGPQFRLENFETFEEKVFPITWRGDGKCGKGNLNSFNLPADCDPYSDMPCCSEFGWCGNSNAHCRCEKCERAKKLEDRGLEKENIFNPHFGYVNLFPIFFGYLQKESAEFRNLIKKLKDEKVLNSPYGIRSLSKGDLLYHKGEDYWRGNIWININYLTLRGLKLFYRGDTEAMEVYEEIRMKVVENVYRNWEEKGMFFEQYSDLNGDGLKATPFNGWSSLVLEMITGNFEDF